MTICTRVDGPFGSRTVQPPLPMRRGALHTQPI